ncbi:STAS domain-containing protein [Actinocorallia populi]|uniref:STAS domain-containing protein n=1 Tax=Actinocorallia populi TaxID=2079200 RepID=UPI001300BCC1|nr:STAS domain-containing protein [Actinocorallia populi]
MEASELNGPEERVLIGTSLLKVTAFNRVSGLRFHGDVDICTIDHVSAAVAEAVSGDEREVYLDLAGLDFCGIEGLRLFVDTAQRLGRQGRGLVLCSVAPHLVRLLQLIGWDRVPGLFVVPRRPAAPPTRDGRPGGVRPQDVRPPRRRPEGALRFR